MNKKQQIKEKLHSFTEWCKDIGGLIREHKTIAISIFVFIALVLVAVIVSVTVGQKSPRSEVSAIVETTTAQATEEETLVVPDEPLEEDAYAEVNAVVKKYYQAMAEGDMETLLSIATGLDEKEQIKISKKSEYVESYPTVICYTKKGPTPDSHIVYAYYEVKLKDFETLTPGMNALFVCKNEDGAFYINGETQGDDLIDYCEIISAQDDVVDLINTVQVKYNEVKAADVELSRFLDELPDILTAAVGEELAKLEAEANAAAAAEAQAAIEAEETSVEENSEEGETEEPQVVVKTVKTTAVVNVRSSDSVSADKVGKAELGKEYKLLEEKANGWSKIEFEGEEAFIKTEYLETVEEEEVEVEEEDDEDAEEAAANSPTSGTATVTDTVNIRKSASTTADKLGVCYPGEKLEVIMKQADGWTKVKYSGKTGYVKSEFLE